MDERRALRYKGVNYGYMDGLGGVHPAMEPPETPGQYLTLNRFSGTADGEVDLTFPTVGGA